MLRVLIASSVLLVNLVVAPINAQQGAVEPRIPIGLTLIPKGAVPLSSEDVIAAAEIDFTAMDIDLDGNVAASELAKWQTEIEAGLEEKEVRALRGVKPKQLMQSIDHNDDKRISWPEFRALAIYDFSVHDIDEDNLLSAEEVDAWHATSVAWAKRPCLEFGVGEGMLVGAFCGR